MEKIKRDSMPTDLIFIVGNSRSGTTMLGQVLGNQPDIFTFNELHFFEQLWMPVKKEMKRNKKEAYQLFSSLLSIQRSGYLAKIGQNKFIDESIIFINSLEEDSFYPYRIFELFLKYETILNKKRIPCEQTPRNLFYAKEIMDLYPSSKIINLIRDPRDVLLSQKNKWKRIFWDNKNKYYGEAMRRWVNYHPYTISRLWNSAVKFSMNFYDCRRFYSLRFEDLLENPYSEIKKLCNFLGVEYDQKMLEIPHIASSFQRDDMKNKGINKNTLQRWKRGGLNNEELYFCQKINSDLINEMGYEIKNDLTMNRIKVFYYYLTLPIKFTLAIILNLKRSKSILASVRRRLLIPSLKNSISQ